MFVLILVLTTATCVEQSLSSQDKWLWFFLSASYLPSTSCTFCSMDQEHHQILRLILKRVLLREVNHQLQDRHRHHDHDDYRPHHRYRLFHATHIRRNKEWEESHKRRTDEVRQFQMQSKPNPLERKRTAPRMHIRVVTLGIWVRPSHIPDHVELSEKDLVQRHPERKEICRPEPHIRMCVLRTMQTKVPSSGIIQT